MTSAVSKTSHLRPERRRVLGILLSTVALLAGCESAPRFALPWKRSKADQPVRRALTMWTFSSREAADGQTERGFQGKALFFAEGSDDAQPATGQVEVHIYELANAEWQLRRRFVSEGEAWKQNERETALGTVYDIFVPHDTDSQRRYSIVLTLQTKDGGTIKSPVAHLP